MYVIQCFYTTPYPMLMYKRYSHTGYCQEIHHAPVDKLAFDFTYYKAHSQYLHNPKGGCIIKSLLDIIGR